LINSVISWNALTDAIGYLIYKDGRYIGATTTTTYADATGTGTYTVKSINSIGVLSEAGTIPTALKDIQMTDFGITLNRRSITLRQTVERMQLLTATGKIIAQNTNESVLMLNKLSQGVYILKIDDKGSAFAKKIAL
jgi:hypothetical protein